MGSLTQDMRDRPNFDKMRMHLKPEKPTILIVTQLFPQTSADFVGLFVQSQLLALTEWFRFVVVVGVVGRFSKGEIRTRRWRRNVQGLEVIYVRTSPALKTFPSKLLGQHDSDAKILANIKERLASLMDPICTQLHHKHNFALVHGHEAFVGDEAVPLAKRLNIPSIVTLHGLCDYHRDWFGAEAMNQVVPHLQQASDLIGVSEKVKESYADVLSSRSQAMKIIPNGISHVSGSHLSQKWQDQIQGRRVLLSVGFLNREKRFDVAISAAAQMRRQVSDDFVLVVVGEGDQARALRQLTRELRMESHVLFAGKVAPSEMPSWYQVAEFLVHPSVRESFSMVCLEAMSFGKPVICTNGVGMADLIASGQEGYVVEPGNADSLTQAMVKLFADPVACNRMGQQAHHRSLDFAWPLVTKELRDLYDSLIVSS